MSNVDLAPAAASICGANRPDRRRGERTYTVFRVARIVLPDGDQLGIVRNISQHGIKLELHADVAIGDEVLLDLGEGHRLTGQVRWRNAASAGLNFIEPIDVARVLGHKTTVHDSADGKIPRLPRIKADSPAEITFAGRVTPARVVNISIGGACVETGEACTPHEPIALTIPSLPTKVGIVRWQRGHLAGIAFDRPMAVNALMGWLASRRTADRPAAPAMARCLEPLSDARLAHLYQTSIDQLAMVVVTDRKGMIVRANQRFELCSGYLSDDLVGRNFHALHATPLVDMPIDGLAEGQSWRGEIELLGSNASRLSLNALVVGTASCPDLITCFMFEIPAKHRTAARTVARDAGSMTRIEGPDADQPGSASGYDSDQAHDDRLSILSRRELQVLKRVAVGLSNEEIAEELGLSSRTVEIYRAKLLEKLGAKNTAAGILIACRAGIL